MFNLKKILKTLATTTLILSLVLGTVTYAFTPHGFSEDSIYVQDESIVNKYFKDTGEKFNTPSFDKDNNRFTTHEQMMDFIYDLDEECDFLTVLNIGQTAEGREMPLLLFSSPGVTTPEDTMKLNKPIVWYQAQVHGNEQAGGEGALVVAQRLANKEIDVLDEITVVIAPRINGDGAYYNERRPTSNIDPNRDYLTYNTIEVENVVRAMNKFKPEVVIDGHEYGIEDYMDPGKYITAYDLLIGATAGADVPQEILDITYDKFVPNVFKMAERKGFSINNYYYALGRTEDGTRIVEFEGGDKQETNPTSPLYNIDLNSSSRLAPQLPAIAMLIETRGIGIGKGDWTRRVDGQVSTVTSMLNTTASNASEVYNIVYEAREEIINSGKTYSEDDTIAVQWGSGGPYKTTVDVIDLETKKKVAIDVLAYYSGTPYVKLERPKPTAYLISEAHKDVIEKLAIAGATIKQLTRNEVLTVESYEVTECNIGTRYVEGLIPTEVATEISTVEKTFNKGTYIVTMDQPSAIIIAYMLEPESANSLVYSNFIKVNKGDTVPVYRYISDKIPASVVVDLLQ